MIPIHPIIRGNVEAHYGKPVYIVMKDGTEHIGILSRMKNGQLFLNEQPALDIQSSRGKASKRKKNASTQIADAPLPVTAGYYPPYPPHFYGPRLVLDAAAIALLFLIAFL
jgi:hypothetical protein